MASVTFKITSTEDNGFVMSENKDELVPAYKAGQIIFVEDLGRIYVDFHNKRTCYTPDLSELSVNMASATKFIGVSDNNPLLGNVTVGDNPVSPKKGDIVVWGKKEYLYREDEDGNLGWHELGDEDAPTWDED